MSSAGPKTVIGWPWLVGVGAILVVLALTGVRAWQQWHDRSTGGGSAEDGPPPVHAETVDDVRVWGRAGQSRLRAGDRTTLWLFIENRSDETISDLRIVALDAPGFEIPEGGCWPTPCELPGCAPICRFGEPGAQELPPSLAPGESTGVWGPLVAGSLQPGASISASLSWSRSPPAGAPPTTVGSRPATAIVGPFYPAERRRVVAVVLGSLYEVLKDLGLPIALAVLAFVLKRIQSDRDLQRKASEDEEARQHQTYESLLPRAHENAVRFLLPMVINASQAAGEIGKARNALPDRDPEKTETEKAKRLAIRRAFYYFILLFKRNFHLIEKGGGYFFESLEGELRVYHCWNELFGRAVQKLGYVHLYALIDRIDPNDSLLRFESRFCSREDRLALQKDASKEDLNFTETFTKVRRDFEDWILSRPSEPRRSDLELLLALFSGLAQYEINRLYRLWYRSSDPGEDEKDLQALTCEVSHWGALEGDAAKPLRELHAKLVERFPAREARGGRGAEPAAGTSTGGGGP